VSVFVHYIIVTELNPASLHRLLIIAYLDCSRLPEQIHGAVTLLVNCVNCSMFVTAMAKNGEYFENHSLPL
jgi:hypothetical protein